MAFGTQTVTIKGAELLAAATAANQLIIDGCDATTGYMTQAQAVNISARLLADTIASAMCKIKIP